VVAVQQGAIVLLHQPVDRFDLELLNQAGSAVGSRAGIALVLAVGCVGRRFVLCRRLLLRVVLLGLILAADADRQQVFEAQSAEIGGFPVVRGVRGPLGLKHGRAVAALQRQIDQVAQAESGQVSVALNEVIQVELSRAVTGQGVGAGSPRRPVRIPRLISTLYWHWLAFSSIAK
jgi:hypothetical protein